MSGETNNVSRTIEVSIAHVGLDGGIAKTLTVAFGQLAAQPYWDNIQNKPTFATVATSGNYNDLSNKPDLSTKQDVLVSGVNIKTVNEYSLLGSGNVNIQTGLIDVRYNSKGKVLQKSENGSTYSDIVGLRTLKEDMDLANVTNDAQVKRSEMGVANGVAVLDASGYVQQSELQLKTINNESIKGTGNIEIQGGDPNAVLFTEQTLTSGQQAQARTNIGAGTSDFSGNYNDLSNKPTIPTVPEISTNINTDAASDTKTASPHAVKTYVDNKISAVYKPAGSVDSVANLGSLTEDNLGKVYNMTNAFTTTSDFLEGAGKAYPAGTNVAIVVGGNDRSVVYKYDVLSGNVDLSNYVEKSLTAGLLKNDGTVDTTSYGTYSKPSGGIPSTDLASGVTTSLGKADTAYQKPSSGIPASDLASGVIPTVPTISTNISSDASSDTKTASPKAVKTYVDNAIPSVPVTDVTVGGTSVVSSGTAVIPSIPTVPTISTDIATDKSSTTKTAAPSAVYNEVHPSIGNSQPSGGMLPNVLYKLGTLSGSVTISLASPTDSSIENEYRFTFTADSTAPTITWPNTVTKWIGNSLDNGAPKVEVSTYYEVSIEDGYGIFNAF